MANGRSGNLPLPLSSFVGRDRECTELGFLLHNARLVTLIGLGGVGKTRLALKVAKDASSQFRHGAWMVELAGIRDSNAVPDAVAAAVGVTRREGDLVDTLVGFLRRKQLLLLLDNCEHLLGCVAELVRRLESSCPELVVLCTSRERLGLAGERVVALTPMGLPASRDPDAVLASDAGRLFIERAMAAKADFTLAPTNAGAIADVVRQLDGIPLALELAAARVPVLSPAQLAQRLIHRFRLLADGARGATERHATLEAAIGWSYDLLSEDQQRLLARLSVFAGGCTLEAVEAVCSGRGLDQAEMLELLSALVARSLVAVTDQVVPSNLYDGERRYRLLETVRQYAEERLDPTEASALRAHHVEFYVEFLETAALGLRGPDELGWIARVEVELENLRTALAGALATGDAVHAERLVWAAAESERGPISAALLGNTDAVLALPGIDAIPRYSYALTASAMAALFRGDWDEAEQLCDRALRATDEPDGEIGGWTAHVRAITARMCGGSDRWTLAEQQEGAWRCFCRSGKPYLIVRALNVLTTFRPPQDLTLAAHEAGEALALAYRTGNPGLISAALAALAGVVADSDPERSRALITESLELADRLGPIAVNEQALLMNTTTMARLGERRAVLSRSALALDRGFSGTFRLCVCFENIGSALAPEAADAAAVLFGHIDAAVPGLARGEPQASLRARANEAICAQLGPSRAEELRMRGAALGESAATEFALDAMARVLAAEQQRAPTMRFRSGAWELSFRTETATVADSKGLRDLAILLRRPGRDVHALELIGSPLHGEATTELADRTALSQYRLRLADLDRDRSEAERNNDTERIARVDVEREAILQELRSVTAIGGKARLSGARASERARKAVTARVRTAIRQLAGPMPDLAAHLDQAVMTGTWCRYSADIAERWSVDT